MKYNLALSCLAAVGSFFQVYPLIILRRYIGTMLHFLPSCVVKSGPKHTSRILPERFTRTLVEQWPFFFPFFDLESITKKVAKSVLCMPVSVRDSCVWRSHLPVAAWKERKFGHWILCWSVQEEPSWGLEAADLKAFIVRIASNQY